MGNPAPSVLDRLAALDAFALGGLLFLETPPQIYTGAGAPVDANFDISPNLGSLYLRNDGGASTTLYVKTGATTWTASSTVAVAGSTTQVQFNDAGSLAGNAGLLFLKTPGALVATVIAGILQNHASALAGSSDALPIGGSVFLTGSGVDATTLATPSAGAPGTGHDGRVLTVTDTTGHAHTITTASDKIAPSHDTITFNGTVGSFVTLEAFNGIWYVKASGGVAFSEV